MEASAAALSVSEALPPPDTLVGTVKFASGTPAGISITFAGSVLRFSLSVTGTKGSLEVRHILLKKHICCAVTGIYRAVLHGHIHCACASNATLCVKCTSLSVQAYRTSCPTVHGLLVTQSVKSLCKCHCSQSLSESSTNRSATESCAVMFACRC